MKNFWALLLITAVFIVSGCGSAGNGKTADGKITVAASFYPMAEFARAVGGSHAEVYTMIGDGIEPHDWEPSARDLTRLAKAKVFVYNGGVEPWAQPALDAVADEGVLPGGTKQQARPALLVKPAQSANRGSGCARCFYKGRPVQCCRL